MSQTLPERQIAMYRDRIASNQKALGLIDSGKISFQEATLENPTMHDVTAERRLEILANIETYENSIRAWQTVA